MKDARPQDRQPPRPAPRRQRTGFTLLEMMVVVGLVIVLATVTLPSIIALFNAGADAQAYNLLAAQLTAARALAIEKGDYAGVHVQLADAEDEDDPGALLRPELEHVCYSALVNRRSSTRMFKVYETPRRVPGSMCFGKIVSGAGGTVSGESYTSASENVSRFTTFTVVFDPFGSAVRTVQGGPVQFDPNDAVFTDPDPGEIEDYLGSQRLWELDDQYCQNQNAVTAMTMFDFAGYYNPAAGSGDNGYLNENAQFLPLNIHTGQLYPRE